MSLIRRLKSLRESLIPKQLLDSVPYRLLQNWVFQGTIGSSSSEIIFRTVFELSLFASLAGALSVSSTRGYVGCILSVHTLMWLFNGHFWALKISDMRRMIVNDPQRVRIYIESLEKRVRKSNFIEACVLSGSLAEYRFGEHSDIDIWFTRKCGSMSWVPGSLVAVRERFLAFLLRMPVELYVLRPDDCSEAQLSQSIILLKDESFEWARVFRKEDTVDLRDVLKKGFFFGTVVERE